MTGAKRGGKRVGYVRVSTTDQNTERQLAGVNVDKVYTDKVSGKDTNRPALKQALEYMRDGDVLVVHSMDRLSRNLSDMLALVKELTGRGIVVEFVKESLTFAGDDSPMQTLQMHIMGAVAQFERSMIKARQAEGIAVAKQAGKYAGVGRKAKLDAETVEVISRRMDAGETVTELSVAFGVSRQTIYNNYRRVNIG